VHTCAYTRSIPRPTHEVALEFSRPHMLPVDWTWQVEASTFGLGAIGTSVVAKGAPFLLQGEEIYPLVEIERTAKGWKVVDGHLVLEDGCPWDPPASHTFDLWRDARAYLLGVADDA